MKKTWLRYSGYDAEPNQQTVCGMRSRPKVAINMSPSDV